MAIPCESCGGPVHEQIVVCPHCGRATGVPIDPLAEQQAIATQPPSPRAPHPEPLPFDKVLVEPNEIPRAVALRRKRRR